MKELDMSFNQPGASGGAQLLSVGQATLKLDQEEEYSPLLLKTYAFPLTLDTNTTNPNLSLSENNRKVTGTSEPQSYPDHPDRFQSWPQVLCREGLTGCWYGEVEWSGTVRIGGTSRRINRRGTSDDALLGFNDLSWSLVCDDEYNRYSVCHNKKKTVLLVRPSGSNRVAVYVDRPAGRLSFYRVSSETHTHLYTFQTTFTETLYAGFWVYTDSSVSLCQIEPVVPTSFSPVVHTEHTTRSTEYRFQCPGAGLFQCSDTRLVFGTWRGGDVLYRTVQWEERCLPSTGRTPAGPLFDIQCPQNAICQLHLPHCAITPGDVDLCVANITYGTAYLLEPQKVTQTHVVLNVDNPSLYGLLWKKIKEYFCPISGQVLLFLQPPGRRLRKLSLLMLPGNADLDKVKTFYENFNTKDILESTSDCNMTPDLRYRLQCASHCLNPTIHPENVKYYLNYGPNYNPTFKVTMDRNVEVASLAILGPENHQVWKDDIELEDASTPSPGSAHSQPDATTAMVPRQKAETLRSVRLGFVKRVSEPVILGLLDRLLDENVLNDAEMDSVRLEKGRSERARELIDMVRKKGDVASAKMIAALREEDPTLYDDLGLNKP